MPSDDSSFFLYGIGEKPEALTLGSLVLEKYWQPLIARHYTHELLKGQDLEDNAWSSTLKNCTFYGHTRLTPGVGVSGLDVVDLRLAWHKDHERVVMAESGTRMVLKDPEQFLHTHVLTNPQAQTSLKLWLSSARSQYVMNLKWARRPKIWLLTGLYNLSKTRTITRKTKSSKIEAGLSSAIVNAFSGVPVGGSVSLGQGDEWEMQMEMDEGQVWAAQYRLLDARYLFRRNGGGVGEKERNNDDDNNNNNGMATMPLPVMGLYKDILSVNMKRGVVEDEVEIGLTPSPLGSDGEEREEEKEEEFEEYEKRLEEAIRIFEDAPPRLLTG